MLPAQKYGEYKENGWRAQAIFASIILMLVSVLISRAALSISMMFFFGLTLVHGKLPVQLGNFVKNRLLVSISLLFFLPLLSGLWSNDHGEWTSVMQMKLPLLLFPVAFAGDWSLSRKQWNAIARIFLFAVFSGCCWSLILYLQQMPQIHEAYLRAKVIATPMDNDHIRFSWLVCLAVITCFVFLEQAHYKKSVAMYCGLAVFFAVFLHLLAARMGLVCLYVFIVLYGFYKSWKTGNKKIFFILSCCLIVLPLLAWLCLPTFQNRMKYLIYDLRNVRSQSFLPGSNDGARVLSLKAGWQILKENPLGTGAGDLKKDVQDWYDARAPFHEGEKFLPCSELLVFGGFGGWPAVILLIGVLALPFFMNGNFLSASWYSLNAVIALNFLFDMAIEAQFGVFIYAFVILWWWRWLQSPPDHSSRLL